MIPVITKAARRFAPRLVANVRTLATLDQTFDQGPARFLQYEKELRALRREVDELRRDNRRVAELYDAVFAWAGQSEPALAAAAGVDAAGGLSRVGDELSRGASAETSTTTSASAASG